MNITSFEQVDTLHNHGIDICASCCYAKCASCVPERFGTCTEQMRKQSNTESYVVEWDNWMGNGSVRKVVMSVEKYLEYIQTPYHRTLYATYGDAYRELMRLLTD